MEVAYPNAQEEIPPHVTEQILKGVKVEIDVDEDHTGNLLTQRSDTCIIVYNNNSPIFYFIRFQNNVNTLIFVSEFFALCITTEIS